MGLAEWGNVTTDVYALIVSILALLASVVLGFSQAKLMSNQNVLTSKLSGKDRLLTQRQMFVALWPYISNLNHIDPAAPVEVDVVRAANALELVAVCWEADVIDRDLIRRTFAASYLEMYDRIEQVPKLPRGATGREILRAAPAVGNVYRTLQKEREEGNAIRSLDVVS